MFKGKARALLRHAKRRANTRYGLDLTNNDLQEIVRLIKQQKAKFIERQSLRVTHWEVEYKGETLRAVYDKRRSQIVTFLPPD